MNIPKEMMALVCYKPGDYKIEKVSVPELYEGEILIKVEVCGICAGDIKAYHGAESLWGSLSQSPYIKAPVIPGHEFVGKVVAKSKNVKHNVQIGDRIIAEQIVPCWECKFCKTGRYWMCNKHDCYGFQSNVNGAMAEYMKITKESIVHIVPYELPLDKAVLIEPYSCAKHCVDRANVSNEDVVVLSGAGTLGLGMVGGIKMRNPKKLVVLDLKDNRLELAKKFGADIVINPIKEDVKKIVDELTEGYGCDIYIEAAGHPESVKQGLELIRKLGRFVEFSVFNKPTTVDWSIIGDRKELDILGVHLSPYCYETVIEWIANGNISTEGVVTDKFSLKDWEAAFKTAEKSKESLKVVLIP